MVVKHAQLLTFQKTVNLLFIIKTWFINVESHFQKRESFDWLGYGLKEKRCIMKRKKNIIGYACRAWEAKNFGSLRLHRHNGSKTMWKIANGANIGDDGDESEWRQYFSFKVCLPFQLWAAQATVDWVDSHNAYHFLASWEWMVSTVSGGSKPKADKRGSLIHWIPKSGDTIKNWILAEFKRRQSE